MDKLIDDDRYLHFAGRNADLFRFDGEHFPAQRIETRIGPPRVVTPVVESVLNEAVEQLGGLRIAVNTAGGGIGMRTISKDGPPRIRSPSSERTRSPARSCASRLLTRLPARVGTRWDWMGPRQLSHERLIRRSSSTIAAGVSKIFQRRAVARHECPECLLTFETQSAAGLIEVEGRSV